MVCLHRGSSVMVAAARWSQLLSHDRRSKRIRCHHHRHHHPGWPLSFLLLAWGSGRAGSHACIKTERKCSGSREADSLQTCKTHSLAMHQIQFLKRQFHRWQFPKIQSPKWWSKFWVCCTRCAQHFQKGLITNHNLSSPMNYWLMLRWGLLTWD